MNWRWLIMDYVDPKLGLTWKQRREIWWYIRTKPDPSNPNPRRYWRTYIFAAVPAATMLVVLLPVFLFKMHWTFLLVVIPAQLIITWLAMALVGAWAHRPLVRYALRHHGFEVCIDCGYDLRGLDDDTKRCPECGAERA